MFNKKSCPRCGKKTKDSFDFCPNCGNQLNKNMGKDYGMLGKNDTLDEFDMFAKSFLGGGMLGKMLGGTMKMLEKEMRQMEKEMKQELPNQPRTNFQMFVNGKKVNLGNHPSQKQITKKQIKEAPALSFSKNKKDEFSKLPKKEPETNLKRLPEEIIYEIKMPGVKSLEDVSLMRMENSIEVKAISKTKAYSKIINISLPIINYELYKGILTLELKN